MDIYNSLLTNITDPFVLVNELSSTGLSHWHIIWLTSKSSDNAKHTLQNFLPKDLSIACQHTRSLKHLLEYILKDPLILGVNEVSTTFMCHCITTLDIVCTTDNLMNP